jgi:hypothetical protein
MPVSYAARGSSHFFVRLCSLAIKLETSANKVSMSTLSRMTLEIVLSNFSFSFLPPAPRSGTQPTRPSLSSSNKEISVGPSLNGSPGLLKSCAASVGIARLSSFSITESVWAILNISLVQSSTQPRIAICS